MSSGSKAEEINKISRCTVVSIEVQEIRTDDTMVFHRAKSCQQSSRNIVPRAAEYDAMRKRTVIPIQEIKKECMMILHKKKEILVNDVISRSNPDYNSVIYLNADNVAQHRLVS